MAETEPHESTLPPTQGFMAQREAEMNAGREKVRERMEAADANKKENDRLLREADERLKEDEENRKRILDTTPAFDKAYHDQAGAEVIDQAQTALEAVQHLADRAEPIIDMRRERRVEKLEDETVNTQAATDLVTDHVTAQAVNQPTVIAEGMGIETEGRPLNNSPMFTDDELALGRLPTPAEKHVPKTRARAEEIAREKVPPTEKVVKEAAVVSDTKPDQNEAVEIVKAAPDEALNVDGTPETDNRSTTSPRAFKRR